MAEASRPEALSPLKQALLQLREMRARIDELEHGQHEPIAVIGLGLRLPGGANDPESLWQLLHDGVDTIVEVPAERWDINAFYDPDPAAPGKMTTRFGAFLTEVDRFDAAFFGIAPREAISMDPQQRLLLEVAWEALERAGQSPDRLIGSDTGVFVGFANSDYFRRLFADPATIDAYAGTGNTGSVAAGRIAYLLGLQGPALAIDTACSSSLVAVHLAVQSLRRRECGLALAGGVNLILSPEVNINFSKAQGMMAPDGRCKTFDARADGYVRGEGCGLIVLKRLAEATRDGDPILAVIRGSAVNQDGRSSGLTAPNGPSQEAVIRAALADAGVAAREIGYVEAHGTGTSLGDPIEVRALGSVLCRDRSAEDPLWIGSLKTNMGHLETAAGIAGLMKVVLALQHGEIPPHLHFEAPSPHIPWGDFAVAVPRTATAWPASDGRRCAGVSSFGFSGTNAHVVLEAAPATTPRVDPIPAHERLLTLSARSPSALRASAARVAERLRATPELALDDVSHTLNAGRAHLPQRLVVAATTTDQAATRLAAFAEGRVEGITVGQAQTGVQPDVAFLFTGQGSHYVGMGRRLYETEPVFRATLDECAALLQSSLDRPLLSVLYPEPAAPALIDDMRYAQPALFAIEVALARLWRAWGVTPIAVAGHSVGEYAAACVAGIFSLADGLKLTAARGRLMQSLAVDGEMVTVFADEARVAAALAPFADRVALAAINGPETVVISGQRDAVREVVARLKAERIRSRTLPIAQASHSPLIEPILDAFARTAETVEFHAPQVSFVSSLVGREVTPDEVTRPEFWRRHFRQTVRFADAMRALFDQGLRVFLEIGPNPTLLTLGERCIPDDESLAWLPSLRQGRDEREQMLETAATLHVRGAALDWDGVNGDADNARRSVVLPTYPWERKSYWWSTGGTTRPVTMPRRWEAAVAAAQRQALQAPLDLALHTYAAKWTALDRLVPAYAANTLAALGAFQRTGETQTSATLIERLGILPLYRHLMHRWLTRLADEGRLRSASGGAFVADTPLSPVDVLPLWSDADGPLGDVPFLRDYVRDCGDRLAPVLTGAESPLETLFPGGSTERTEALYEHWAVARYLNAVVRAAVEGVAQGLPPERPVRVLEVGAGTGATTSAVLPGLDASRARYDFTDVSELFLGRAAQKFDDFAFMRYRLLDIEQPPEPQGYGAHGYDVIVAANVLHAAKDLDAALRHLRSLLASNGVLVLLEATTHQAAHDITIGLIEGWQRFDDSWRTETPLLSLTLWRDALLSSGFEDVRAFPEAGSPAEVLGQHVVLARGPVAVEADVALESVQPQNANEAAAAPLAPSAELVARIRDALPTERLDLVADVVRGIVARVLRLDTPEAIDRRGRLMDLGVDSLMALEVRNLLTKGLGLERTLPATLMFDYPTIDAIAGHLLTRLTPEPDPSPLPIDVPAATGADIEALSDEEVEALLIEKLRTLGA